MIIRLILAALVAIPFLELIVYGFLPAQVTYADTRAAKEFLTIFLCFAIISYKILNDGLKISNKNVFLLLFLPWMFMSLIHAPNYGLTLGEFDITGFWNFKPMLYVFIYYLLFSVFVDQWWSKETIKSIISVISHCGLAMALWAIVQRLGFDQVFFTTAAEVGHATQYGNNLTGSLGRPEIMACYLSVCFAASIYLKRYAHIIISALVIVLSKSEMALAAVIVSSFVFLFIHKRAIVLSALASILVVIALIVSFQAQNPTFIQHTMSKYDSGRYPMWQQTVKDMTSPVLNDSRRTYFLTGMGPGAFYYVFPIRHPQMARWKQAHNEYLEVFHNYGFIGLGIFLSAIGLMLYKIRKRLRYRDTRVFLAIFSALAVGSFGTFLWQLAPFQYLTVLVAAILHYKGATIDA